MSDTTTTLTITLSDRRPVEIVRDDWPVVAKSDWFSGQHRSQANEVAWIKVRCHVDGRIIVYGVRESGNGGMPFGYRDTAAGYLVDPDDENGLIRSIRRVAGAIGMQGLGDEAIGDLPAESLK